VPNSKTTDALAAGDYAFQAVYSGDSNYSGQTGACEPFSLGKASPAIVTTQDPTSGVVGSVFNDTATLSGGVNLDGTGSITFTLYDAADCGGNVVDTETVDHINANAAYSTPTGATLNQAGTYYWVASFSGDSNNNSFTSPCNDEPVTVTKASPTIVTTQDPASGSTGDTFKDTATLSDAVNLDGRGSITFTLYDAADCGGNVVDTETVGHIGANGDYSTPIGATLSQPGTYYWVARFSGDANNNGVKSRCNDEPVTVNAPAIHIVKTADAAQVNAGEPIGFTLTVYNDGSGDAHGVTLTDTLPTNPGLSWSIDKAGSGWGSSCAIASGVLSCGPVTVPAGTTQAASTFTVHITSPTTADTGGVCPEGSGVVSNTGDVSTTNDGSDESTASTCVAAPAIHILKTADAAKVNVGSPIGFTMTVWNDGSGDAHGVTLTDPLPTNAGLSWSIDKVGAGWGSSCSIAAGTLSCGPVTVPAGTTQTASTFTVHVVSGTAAAAGGDCPGSGEVDNTGSVTTSNDGSGQSSASTCVQALVDLSITKSGAPNPLTLGTGNITWTIVVTNNGPDADTGVTVSDPMPAGNAFVSANSTQGSCTGGAILSCNIGNMAAGASVTITLVTTPSTTGNQVNTATVAGNRPETNTANNQASATVLVVGPATPPVFCVAVSKVTPKQLFVGRKTKLTIHVTQHGKAVSGIHVQIKGPKIDVRTAASNNKGVVTRTVKMKKAGILIFSPIASKRCNTKRVGVTNVFTPPVTG
jgi:uncharacterized repeat protein (TIGR01451 family)